MQATRNAAAVFDGRGQLLCLNGLAEARIGDLFDVVRGALVFHDRTSQSGFDALLGLALRSEFMAHAKPLVQSVKNRGGASVVIQAVALMGVVKHSFALARVLVLFGEPEGGPAMCRCF